METESEIVAVISELLALEIGASLQCAKQIGIAGFYHDVGKKAIPVQILNKPGKLTAVEFEVIKTHTSIGARMMAHMRGTQGKMIREVCSWHHEYWDGSGYMGIPACRLPCYAQIVALVDVFVALASKRPYKPMWLMRDAVNYIGDKSGKQFNPRLVKRFLLFANREKRMLETLVGRKRCVA